MFDRGVESTNLLGKYRRLFQIFSNQITVSIYSYDIVNNSNMQYIKGF